MSESEDLLVLRYNRKRVELLHAKLPDDSCKECVYTAWPCPTYVLLQGKHSYPVRQPGFMWDGSEEIIEEFRNLPVSSILRDSDGDYSRKAAGGWITMGKQSPTATDDLRNWLTFPVVLIQRGMRDARMNPDQDL